MAQAAQRTDATRAVQMQDAATEGWSLRGHRLRLILEVRPPSRRRYDLDNATSAAKASIDAVCTVWGLDDGAIDEVTVRRGPWVRGGALVLTLEALAALPASS